MATTASYKSFLRVLEKWPVDSSKKGSNQILEGRAEEDCQRAAASLQRLANNQYGTAYTRLSRSSSTGLTAEQCTGILSSEFMESIHEENRSLVSKLFGSRN